LAANKTRTADADLLLELALQAGEIGLKYFKSDNKVWYKEGNSPVSQADKEIDDYLRLNFTKARPDYGWLSEETEDHTDRLNCERVALKRTFLASKGHGLEIIGSPFEQKDRSSKPLVTGSKKLIDTIQNLPDAPFAVMEFIPSLAYRLALVAVGELDGAFARGGASEWDIAAADLILEEVGCLLTDDKKDALSYNRANVQVPALIASHNNRYEEIFTLAKQAGFLH